MNPDLQVPLSVEELDAMERETMVTTPGPWEWIEEPASHLLALVSEASWRPKVMDFVRRGFTGAMPRFHRQPHDAVSGQSSLADFLTQPDARFIAKSRYFVPRLIAEVRRCVAVMSQQDAELRRLRALLNNGRSSMEMNVIHPTAPTGKPMRIDTPPLLPDRRR